MFIVTDTPAPLYGRIDAYTMFTCCDERMAACPECDAPICVFCMDMCDPCLTPMW